MKAFYMGRMKTKKRNMSTRWNDGNDTYTYLKAYPGLDGFYSVFFEDELSYGIFLDELISF